jgi:hypothetical protein
VSDLNRRYGGPLANEREIDRFYALVHGHPYLTRRGLAEIGAGRFDLTGLEARADRSDGPFHHHLHRLLTALAHNVELTGIVRDMLNGATCPSEQTYYRLRSAGLLGGETPEESHWRCPMYATYLRRHLSAGTV